MLVINNILSKIFVPTLFGNYSFFHVYDFNKYFESKYFLNEKRIKIVQFFFFILALIFIIFQFVLLRTISSYIAVFEIFLVVLSIRSLNYIIFLQFKDYCTNIETIGYFVLNELLVILETSHSLKEAVQFIISSEYPVYSNIFRNAMIISHFGSSLENSLRSLINKNLKNDIRIIFLNIIVNWENGKNVALVSKNRILNRVSEEILEEINKIDSWSSLSSGIIFLSPPVILCFLLISGNMSVFYGIIIVIGILLGSYFLIPERNLTFFSGDNQLILSNDRESIEFLVILSENLSKGHSFSKSVNIALNAINNEDFYSDLHGKSKFIANFRLGVVQEFESENKILLNCFSSRIIRLLALTKKFSMISTAIAGTKLLTITKEISKTKDMMVRGKAQLKAAKFHRNVIQLLSLISLAFITGASPFFIFVSNMISQSFNEAINVTVNSSFEFVYLLIALAMCFSPVRKSHFEENQILSENLWKNFLKISKFFVFLLVYFIIRSLVHTYF